MRRMKKDMIAKRKNLKLIHILIVFSVGMCILCLLSSGLLSYHIYEKSMTQKIAASRIDVLTQIAERISAIRNNATWFSNYFYYSENVSEYYHDDPFSTDEIAFFEDNFKRLESLSKKTMQATNIVFDYVMMFRNGYTYASNGKADRYEFDQYTSQDWYSQVLENKSSEVWVSVHKDGDSHYVISIARSILDKSGKAIGIFLLNIDEINFYKTYASMIDQNIMYIIDANGCIVSHNEQRLLGINYRKSEELDFIKPIKSYKIIEKNGIDYLLTTYQNMTENWTYAEEIPLSTVMADVEKVKTLIVIVGVIILIVSSGILAAITYQTTRPLRKLVKQLEEVGLKADNNITFDISGWEEIDSICNECNAMNLRINRLLVEIKNSEKKKKTAEMGFLQAQLNPHFIYNTLFSIKCLVEMDKKTQAVGAVESFISMLKYILSYQNDSIEISKEIKMLEDYSKLQKTRYGECFHLQIDCDEKLYSYKILRMILQPLVENSIFHGLPKDRNMIEVKVIFNETKDEILIEVMDDGIGFTNENLERLYSRTRSEEKSNMIGINNIRDQIQTRYGDQYGITIDPNYVGGARVVLNLPKN